MFGFTCRFMTLHLSRGCPKEGFSGKVLPNERKDLQSSQKFQTLKVYRYLNPQYSFLWSDSRLPNFHPSLSRCWQLPPRFLPTATRGLAPPLTTATRENMVVFLLTWGKCCPSVSLREQSGRVGFYIPLKRKPWKCPGGVKIEWGCEIVKSGHRLLSSYSSPFTNKRNSYTQLFY